MAKLVSAFNPQQIDPTQSGGQLPVGRHKVAALSSDVKATKDNTGGQLVLHLQVIEGDAYGSEGDYRFNLYNQSDKAREIAERQLSAVCHVTGVLGVLEDSAQLHNLPFIVEVGLQRDKEAAEKGYTEIKRVFDVNGNEPKAGGNVQSNVQQQAAQIPPQNQGQQQQQQQQSWGGQQQQQQPQNTPPANGNAWGQQQQQQPQGGNTPAWGQQGGSTPAWGQPK